MQNKIEVSLEGKLFLLLHLRRRWKRRSLCEALKPIKKVPGLQSLIY